MANKVIHNKVKQRSHRHE